MTADSSKILYRDIDFDFRTIDPEKRTVRVAFSSEAPVERYDYLEVLDHSREAVDLSRLKRGAPLLLDHDPSQVVGVVEDAEIDDDRKGRATVRFSKRGLAEEVFQDVKDGIRPNISVGYRILKMEKVMEEAGVPTYKATRWMPLEISSVGIPADATVGVGRSEPSTIKIMEPTPPAKPENNGKSATELMREERLRVSTLREIAGRMKAKLPDVEQRLAKAEAGDITVEDFRKEIFEAAYKPEPIADINPGIGMSRNELKQYSIREAILEAGMNGGQVSGFYKECSDEVEKKMGRAAAGFFIPHDVTMLPMGEAQGLGRAAWERANAGVRALNVSTASAGGFTVQTDVLGSQLIELLRNRTFVNQLGATTLGGLVGNVAIPRHTGTATAYWLPESGTLTESDQTIGQLALVPHRLGADTAYQKELVIQSTIDVEGFIRQDLMRMLAIELDRAAINGSGVSGQPIGILNTTGISLVTFSAAATWTKVVSFETALATQNADVGSIAFLTTPAVRGKWKSNVKVSNFPIFLWEVGQNGSGQVNGYRAEATNQVPSDLVVFGNWNDLILATWSGMDVVVDPYSLKKQAQVEITINLWTDIALRHAVSMVCSSDSGAQ